MDVSIFLRQVPKPGALLVLCLQVTLAQTVPTTPPRTGNTGATPPRPSVPMGDTGNSAGPLGGGLYLTGKVMLDDGNPPSEPVTIERVCNGSPRAQGYTDSKGRFSFQMGQTRGVTQDASEEGTGAMGANRPVSSLSPPAGSLSQSGVPDARLTNCDLRAVLGGFYSDTVNLDGRRVLDDPDVGTIVLHRMANVEGSAISVTSLLAPKDAKRAYDKGRQYQQKEKLAEAEKAFKKAVGFYPKYAVAWCALGHVQRQLGDEAQARKSLAKASEADPNFVSPYLEMAALLAKSEQWKELAQTTVRLLKLDAVDYPMAYFYDATAHLNMGEIEAAERSARAGAKLDKEHRAPQLERVLAMILARKKDYAGAVAHLHNYLRLAPDAEDAAVMRKQLAEMRRLAGSSQEANAAAGAKANGPSTPPEPQ